MKKSFYTWDDFVSNFGKEMVSAESVYQSMLKSGLKEFSLVKFDFHFNSDKREKLEKLYAFLKKHYLYTYEPIYRTENGLWELTGVSNSFPATNENLMYWALDLAKRAYEFDAELEGYGATFDNKYFPEFTKSKEDYYFDLAIERYQEDDLSGAIINFNNVLKINSQEVNSYYSRAIVKNELYTWKAAIRDYDKAIELAPNFITAILNRGALKDDNSDYTGALEDYTRVVKYEKSDAKNIQLAYFNRGNTYLHLNEKNLACKDWHKALELGADYAKERIAKYCQKK